jgi:fructuronate reductase
VYVDAWLGRNRGGSWGIRAANIRSNRAIVAQLNAAGFRYHVAEYASRERVVVREIRAIRDATFAGSDDEPGRERLLTWLAAPETRIVTLAISEKGYGLRPADGELLEQDPTVAHDIANPRAPHTAPGLLVEALRRRRAAGVAPFTVLSCDNMPANGVRTRAAVTQLAQHASAELAAWAESEVAFPSSMVDRIVPAVTLETRARIAALIGGDDPAAIACEAFSQWVVEDRFPLGRPDWEREGVEMVTDVRPFEAMKLRMLNGAHSLLAYVGSLAGHETVAQAVADERLVALVRRYWTEARASLEIDVAIARHADVESYTTQLLERFANDSLEHKLMQIAMDGSQKLPQRWLAGAATCLANGLRAEATAVGVAAWLLHVRGTRPDGRAHVVDDPLAQRFADIHARASGAGVVDALLDVRDVFGAALAEHAAFRDDVRRAYERFARAELPL